MCAAVATDVTVLLCWQDEGMNLAIGAAKQFTSAPCAGGDLCAGAAADDTETL